MTIAESIKRSIGKGSPTEVPLSPKEVLASAPRDEAGRLILRDASEVERIALSSCKHLGTRRRQSFYRLPDGREVLITGELEENQRDGKVGIDEVWLTSRDRTGYERVLRANLFPPGEYERRVGHAERKTDGTPRPNDGLAHLMAGIAPAILDLKPTDREAHLDVLSPVAAAIITDGKPPLDGFAGVMADMKKRGAVIEVSAEGDLMVEFPAMSLDDRARLRDPDMRRGLLAERKGTPLVCAWGKGEQANTIADGGAPICWAHLRGEA